MELLTAYRAAISVRRVTRARARARALSAWRGRGEQRCGDLEIFEGRDDAESVLPHAGRLLYHHGLPLDFASRFRSPRGRDAGA